MDDPNITMEEYIRLEEEKARRRGKVFNWETAKYGKIWYDEDIHDLRSIETEFPAIAFNDELSSEKTLSFESTVSSLNDEIDFRVSFDDSNDEDHTIWHPYHHVSRDTHFLGYEGLEYSDVDIDDFKERMRMEHRDDVDVVEFTSQAWGRLFDTRGPLVRELILEFFSTLRFGEVLFDLDAPGTIQFQLGGARRRLSWRQFILALGLHTREEMESLGFTRYWSKSERMIPEKGDLQDYWRSISTDGDFLGPPPSYTLIRDPVLRLCHRMMAHNIAGRSQAPEKILGGLIVISPELPIIDMAELVRLQICEQLDDTWAWVAMGPERQPDATADSQEAAEDVAAVDEGGQADPTPVQVPLPPPAAARTIPQRMARLEDDVHEIRKELAEHHEVIDTMARDFSRFTVWAASGMARLLDSARVAYTSYSETRIPYQRRVRRRTDEANTSTA
nr:hypothetical protein [Tanacetum cinerariifolium]